MNNETIYLNGTWRLTVLGENIYHIPQQPIPAKVPGTVYTTLLENNWMPDPFYRANELDATRLLENDFLYETRFTLDEEQLLADKLYLTFYGIDTLGEVYCNGVLLGRTDNMHRVWQYEISKLAGLGENTLLVKLFSPNKYIKEEEEKCITEGSTDAMQGYPHIRKAHCMFGWDWGPRLPDAGIFRDVTLTIGRIGRLKECYIRQQKKGEETWITVNGKFEQYREIPLHMETTLVCPDGEGITTRGDEPIVIKNPQLWWPNGYGSQPLYEVIISLVTEDGICIDQQRKRIGIRTMKMNIHNDQWGESFYHEVNGIGIFAMGVDYIPEDNLLGRRSKERTLRLLKRAKEININCIRVWGGGYYPDDWFYDICDELGLLVWQDFMFACSNYELTDTFEENIREELKENIIRIRHHACLALYCGNNEMELQTYEKVFHPSKKQYYDYIKIFEYIIPKVVKEYDPMTFYWPSSPSSGGNFDNPNDENRGDVHYWEVWHGEKPITEYRKFYFRYVSEFGFQSFPSLKTIQTFTRQEDQNIFSRVMEMHQRNRAANGKIMKYLAQTYLYPTSFEKFVYASQMLQLDAIRYGVEHYRRNRGRCMGTIVWQLNDIWPVASWSSIDYYGRLKALHYGEKRFFAPVMISCEEKGELSERDTCVEEWKDIEVSARLCVTNETLDQVSGEVEWELRNAQGRVKEEGKIKCTVPALTSCWFDKIEFIDCDVLSEYFSYRFKVNEKIVSEGTVLFTAPKHFEFQNPELSIERKGNKLIIHSKTFAKGVALDAMDGDLVFSDNYFDMNPGSKEITIEEGTATQITVQSVYDIR